MPVRVGYAREKTIKFRGCLMTDIEREISSELGFGMVPNLFAEASDNPELQTALWKAFRHTVLRGELPRITKEMMGVVVSLESNSPYAAQVHLHALALQGIEQPILDALAQGTVPAGISDKVQALVKFAQVAARDPQSPWSLGILRDAGLDEKEVRQAVGVVALYRMVNTWTDLLAVPVDEL